MDMDEDHETKELTLEDLEATRDGLVKTLEWLDERIQEAKHGSTQIGIQK